MTVDMGFSFYFKVTNLTHGATSDAGNTPHFFYLEFSNTDKTCSIDNSGGTNAITVILRNVTDNITYDGVTIIEANLGSIDNWNGLTIDSLIIGRDMIGLVDELKYFTDPITLTDINNGKI